MVFIWPQGLWLLLLVPALAAGYRRLLAAKKRAALRHPGLVATSRGFGRRVPPFLFVAAVALLLVAIARPTAMLATPEEARTVILAMDVSGSMHADDVEPSRLAAAQAAAREFVGKLPEGVRIGVVAFSEEARLVQPPVASRDAVLQAIGVLQPQQGTAIGKAILASLEALFPGERFSLDETIGVAAPVDVQVDPSMAVILLTDGENSHGPDPLDAARLAAGRGVRVYTVGIGTPWGQIGGERGRRIAVGFDEEALKGIAGTTGGDYFCATTALDLRAIYAKLSGDVVLALARTEISALLCAAAALLATLSAALSLSWFGRVL